MGNKLYVGGLPYSATKESLQGLFEQAGTVASATVITDRETGRSKGFGFVEMGSSQDADNATQKLNGYNLDGRTITVSEAKERGSR